MRPRRGAQSFCSTSIVFTAEMFNVMLTPVTAAVPTDAVWLPPPDWWITVVLIALALSVAFAVVFAQALMTTVWRRRVRSALELGSLHSRSGREDEDDDLEERDEDENTDDELTLLAEDEVCELSLLAEEDEGWELRELETDEELSDEERDEETADEEEEISDDADEETSEETDEDTDEDALDASELEETAEETLEALLDEETEELASLESELRDEAEEDELEEPGHGPSVSPCARCAGTALGATWMVCGSPWGGTWQIVTRFCASTGDDEKTTSRRNDVAAPMVREDRRRSRCMSGEGRFGDIEQQTTENRFSDVRES